MNQKGSTFIFLTIGIFLLLLGGAGLWLYFNNFGSWVLPNPEVHTSQTEEVVGKSDQTNEVSSEESPDYSAAKEKYNLNESQLEILSRVDSSRL